MPSEALKSTPVTNLDALPLVPSGPSSGAPERLRSTDGSITVTDAKTLGSTYQLCRVKSSARLKHVYIGVDVTVTTLTADIGFYYSTSTQDGTPRGNSATATAVNSTSGSQLLGAGVDLKTAGLVDYIYKMTAAKRDQPLWQACGLSVDPGGYFDLVLTTTATNSGAAVAYAEVQYRD